jgi:hypothetical protein
MLNIHGFAFHNHPWLSALIKNYDVGSLPELIKDEPSFNFNQASRTRCLIDQVMDKMLSDPFFRLKHDILFPDNIKDPEFIFSFL